ncbi:hypothetical protein HanPSC8_Chr02g0057501 [Helianthus annuus]|nr:hypothetical protein HanHA89_Chr02g0051631 [Helianthus annuus]KAJ0776763.1 hypothetical protein HanLR1_Chr02g0049381 [Helianthus annuus]KAJ0951225.1 hypothetical protein HanPSC8_Chr02g0057501 [Helianthus annuus]
MFNVFYYVSCTGGFYSFNSRTANVSPCSKDPPKSLHDWKHKFFYIRRGVIPIDMNYRHPDEGIPKLPVVAYVDEQWYKTLIARPTPMLQLEEAALVAAGMIMLWVSTNPMGAPVCGNYFAAYGLMIALKLKVGGMMVTRVLPEGELSWLEQIKDYFHHPMEESLGAHVTSPTCAHSVVSAKLEAVKSLAWRETILLSSEESTASFDAFIHQSRSTSTGVNVESTGGSEAAAHAEPVTTNPGFVADELI